jgi:hypothetical protein
MRQAPDLRRQSQSMETEMSRPRPSVDDLRRFFSYIPETGCLISSAPFVSRRKLKKYFSWRVEGKYLQEHTIIWAVVTGAYPEHTVDHKDRDGFNNRWLNLREATQAQQQVNRRSFSKSGLRGVYPCRGRWEAQVRFDKKTKSLGVFDTAEEAASVVQKAREDRWAEFAKAA